MSKKIQTLKGFRDFLPSEQRKRQIVINTLKEVFELYGFEPLETPALEYDELLSGKYGDEGEKLMYRFTDLGGRKIALRYDQTVPLVRVMIQNQDLPLPFKRYQIQPVWRAENTQKGRYREFLQCDIDIVGSCSLLADAEIISCALKSAQTLGFKDVRMLINDRAAFKDLKSEFVVAIDKLKKIGNEGVVAELVRKGMDKRSAEGLTKSLNKGNPPPSYQVIKKYLEDYGFEEGRDFEFDPTIARGLDYYTGPIFELVSNSYKSGSLGGGGRYDKLIGKFFGQDIYATGFAFGFDRLVELLEEKKLFTSNQSSTKVLVTIYSQELRPKSLDAISFLRDKSINSEIWLNEKGMERLDKQLKYANKKNIPFVIVIGPEEAKKGIFFLLAYLSC